MTQIKRGDRFRCGYRFTVVEIVEAIPETNPFEADRGKPGVLLYADRFGPDRGEPDYQEVLPAGEGEKARDVENLSWVSLARLAEWDRI